MTLGDMMEEEEDEEEEDEDEEMEEKDLRATILAKQQAMKRAKPEKSMFIYLLMYNFSSN